MRIIYFYGNRSEQVFLGAFADSWKRLSLARARRVSLGHVAPGWRSACLHDGEKVLSIIMSKPRQ